MKAFLFLEHKFYKKDNKIYAEKIVNYQYIEKYVSVFDEVCICARCNCQAQDIYMDPIELDEKVSFWGLPNCDSLGLIINYYSIRKEILQIINDGDVAIFRAPSSISYVLYNSIKSKNVPIAVELVADAEVFFIEQKNERMINKVIKRIGKHMLIEHAKTLCSNANAVLYVTNASLQKKYPAYSATNGYSPKHFDIACSDVILLEDYYSNYILPREIDGEFVLCHMGAMYGDNKGQRVVIDIVKDFNRMGWKCRAILIGDGTSRENFELYAKESGVDEFIEFVGQLNDFGAIQKCFMKSHVFVFPSQNEGLPRSIIEAMANSLPCVAYDVGGIGELIDANLLVKKDNYNELFEKIWKIATDEEYRQSIAKANYIKSRGYSDSVLKERRHSFYRQFRNIAEQMIIGG